MICNNCGSQQVEGSKFCSNCGAALGAPATQSFRPTARQGRGGLILTLGVLSLVLAGPFTGIPAWIMGHRDIKNINAGTIDPSERGLTTAGMVMGIIGTCFGGIVVIGITVAVLISLFSAGRW